jgi:hypothetical protein
VLAERAAQRPVLEITFTKAGQHRDFQTFEPSCPVGPFFWAVSSGR